MIGSLVLVIDSTVRAQIAIPIFFSAIVLPVNRQATNLSM